MSGLAINMNRAQARKMAVHMPKLCTIAKHPASEWMAKILAVLLLIACLPSLSRAQVPVSLAPTAHIQFTDGTGKVLGGGFLYTYAAGTTTRQDTYTDSTGTIANAWPIPLDATGSPSNGSTQTGIWLTSSAYKFCAYNSALVQQWCTDNIVGPPFLAGNNVWTGNGTFSGITTFSGAANLNAGGSLSGSFSGTPTVTGNWILSGNPSFTGNPTFSGAPNFSASSPVFSSALIPSLNANAQSITVANNASGTTLNSLAKLTGAPSTAITPLVTDTVGAVGIVVAGAGASGSATIQNTGIASCNFDAATTAGDYVVFSATVAGDCHDVPGGSFPSSGQVLGRTLSTNAASGLYQMVLFATEDRSTSATMTFPNVAFSTVLAPTNASITAQTMVTVGASNATYRYFWYADITTVGTSCTGSTTIVPSLIFQDPNAAGASTVNIEANGVTIVANTGNGTLGPILGMASFSDQATPYMFRAKAGTVIQYSVTYSAGSGCSPAPTIQFFPILEQLTAN